MSAFALAKDRMAVAWDQKEALAILADLEAKVHAFILPHRKPLPLPEPPITVNSNTRWG